MTNGNTSRGSARQRFLTNHRSLPKHFRAAAAGSPNSQHTLSQLSPSDLRKTTRESMPIARIFFCSGAARATDSADKPTTDRTSFWEPRAPVSVEVLRFLKEPTLHLELSTSYLVFLGIILWRRCSDGVAGKTTVPKT